MNARPDSPVHAATALWPHDPSASDQVALAQVAVRICLCDDRGRPARCVDVPLAAYAADGAAGPAAAAGLAP